MRPAGSICNRNSTDPRRTAAESAVELENRAIKGLAATQIEERHRDRILFQGPSASRRLLQQGKGEIQIHDGSALGMEHDGAESPRVGLVNRRAILFEDDPSQLPSRRVAAGLHPSRR